MYPVPQNPIDSSDFLFDFSHRKLSCHEPEPSPSYHPPQRCIIPTPVFRHESPLFSYHSPEDSAAGPGTDPDPNVPGTSRTDLERRSARPYAARVSDPEDFAHVWERTIVPVVIEILQANCDSDFSIDVHNFPELSSGSVPRVIYITLPTVASVALQELVRDELARKIPPRFHQTHLKFRQGTVTKTTSWWGTDDKNLDHVCAAQNAGFHPVPRMGMSVGPRCAKADAGSVGGYIKIRGELFGVSCRHIFEKAIDEGDPRVVHPAQGDHQTNLGFDPRSKQTCMGELFRWSKKDPVSRKDVTRVSLTFDGSGVSADLNRVTMDWCLFGPTPEGKNFLTVPSIDMDRVVAIEKPAAVEGNTEVYAVARTSGYSLGYTSDVPGVRRLERTFRREWTVRQYSPSRWDPSTHLEPSWQCIKRWVTSGIGVPGDSGSWLMRRSDNAVVGLIWARNHNYGDPVERVRLTHITPIVDILADINERVPGEVVFPTYSAADLNYTPSNHEEPDSLGVGHSAVPWSALSAQKAQERRKEEESVIESGVFDGGAVPSCSPHPLRFLQPTTDERRDDESHDSTAFASDSSMSVQVSPDKSNSTSEGMSPVTGGTAVLLQEKTLYGIGVVALLQLGRAGSTPPDLVADLSANSSVSSDLDELDSSQSLSASIRIISQDDGSDDDQHSGHEEEDPVRSKARFDAVDVEGKLLGPRPVMYGVGQQALV